MPAEVPRFDPASYPGPRPEGPVLVHRECVHHLDVDSALPSPLRSRALDPERVPVLRRQPEVRWSVAYGSNASPERLMDKGLDRWGALLLPARLAGWQPAFEARRTGYGAVPLTLVPAPGTTMTTWVLGLLPDDLDELDRTEGRLADDRSSDDGPVRDTARHAPRGTYRLGRVGEVAVADRFVLPDALAYLPGPATEVQRTADGWRTWPDHRQEDAVRGLHGPCAPAPDVGAMVRGRWPATELTEPPSLVPDGAPVEGS